MSEWISVEDRLPEETRTYVVAGPAKDLGMWVHFAEWNGARWIKSEEGYYEVEGVTHWMPLPEPPKC